MKWPTANAPDSPETLPHDSPAKTPNNSPAPVRSRLPRPQNWSTRTKTLAATGALAVVLLVIFGYVMFRGPRSARADLVTHRVRQERVELAIVERGTLESAKNSDIYCTVKSGSKNSTVSTTIKWVIDDGSQVQKGDLLVDLDDSGLQEQLKSQKITLDGAQANKVQTEENYKIVQSQNKSDIKTAEVNLELAEIDLKKYMKGDFPQMLKDVEGRIKVAESDVEQQRDRTAWANRMVKKGYLTLTQAQAEQSRLESYDLSLRKVMEEKRVLTHEEYGLKKRTETDLKNKVDEAKRAQDRVNSQTEAKEVQARIDREAKKSIYEQEASRYKEIQDEIKKCRIFAPQAGMVVYFVPEQARGGGGSQQAIIAQGEPVREGQKLMQIPNLQKMLVNTKVHEALVSRVTSGQPAMIRVDSYPDRSFQGHVETVATISAQQDFMSADVKVYVTKVMIDEEIEGLKPGMSAEVTVTVGTTLENVLAVPIQAIVGSTELGKKRKCFVLTANGPEERDVLVGQSNDRMAEIKEGLREGEEVVLNPRALVGDKAKTRQPGANGNGNQSTDEGTDRPKAPAAKEKRPPDGKDGGEKTKLTPEEREKRNKEMVEKFRQATPEQRETMLNAMPEAYRDKTRQRLKEAGIEVK
ncbi:MAG: efflux RND transporter periplasmic adaptor subunit [Gemmataceae bacterium]|nr:efflux RND transporter periplasmic adaptor subunit [Gemmataceae bacterium]